MSLPTQSPGGPVVAGTPVCGRCRSQLAPDPTLHEHGPASWRLCDPCRAVLLDTRIPRS